MRGGGGAGPQPAPHPPPPRRPRPSPRPGLQGGAGERRTKWNSRPGANGRGWSEERVTDTRLWGREGTTGTGAERARERDRGRESPGMKEGWKKGGGRRGGRGRSRRGQRPVAGLPLAFGGGVARRAVGAQSGVLPLDRVLGSLAHPAHSNVSQPEHSGLGQTVSEAPVRQGSPYISGVPASPLLAPARVGTNQ